MTAANFVSTPAASSAAEKDDSAVQIREAIDAKASELWEINQKVYTS
jgi:hypothetical protein